MNALDLAKKAYATQNAPLRSERGAEYDAFSRCTRQLLALRTRPEPDIHEVARAVYDNRRLWLTIAANVADAANALPDDLRARLLALARFSDRHSRMVLDGAAGPDPLIEINVAIMRGLKEGAGT